jgi:ethanolamine utilization microcompartment shell protein EutL
MGIYGRHIAKGECTMPGRFDKMVCLVGENPLPVYLGIKQLATPEAEVILVYSEATKPQSQNIKGLLEKGRKANGNRGRTCITDQVVQLRDPFRPYEVRKTLDAVVASLDNPRAYALNNTGGTKVMSDYGLLAWIQMQQALQLTR